MTHLPTVHWEDLATKQDLAVLRDDLVRQMDTRFAVMRADMEALEHRLTASFRAELNDQTRTMIFALIAAILTVAVVALGAAGLA